MSSRSSGDRDVENVMLSFVLSGALGIWCKAYSAGKVCRELNLRRDDKAHHAFPQRVTFGIGCWVRLDQIIGG